MGDQDIYESIQEYLDKFSEIQKEILNFIEEEQNTNDNFQSLINIIDTSNIHSNPNDFRQFLYILINISNNHKRGPHFFEKIEKIFQYFKDDIKKNFSNVEILINIYTCKWILLFFIKEQIIEMNAKMFKYLASGFSKDNLKFLYPEYEPFSKECGEVFTKPEITNDFDEKRKIGENDNYICQLIRDDLIDDFVAYVHKTNYAIDSKIESSIFETNSYLIENNPNLIEYAAFFGSIQIFQYLKLNQVELTPSLWMYAIHGNNPEIIHILEDNNVSPESYIKCLQESIACHHNQIGEYTLNEYLSDNEDAPFALAKFGLIYHNFALLEKDHINSSSFYYCCECDYFTFVDQLLKLEETDVNICQVLFDCLFKI